MRSISLALVAGGVLSWICAAPARAGTLADDAHVVPGAAPAAGSGAAPAAEGGAEAEAEEWDITAAHGPVRTWAATLREGTWMSVDVHGERLVFDLLGDLWSLPLAGGAAVRLTSGPAWDSAPRWSPDGQRIAYVSDTDGNEQIWTMAPDGSDRRKLTDEPEARLTDPRWDPRGEWLVVRRRTVDQRSIGVTELWSVHADGGKGVALTSKDAHPHAGESAFSDGGRTLWFSSRRGRFEYDGDPVAGLWDLHTLDRDTGELRVRVHGPGSAARPVPAPDGRTVAFVTRDRTKTALALVDVETGRRTVLWDGLSHDQMEGFALHGVYPGFDWTDDGAAVVLWAQGKLWRVGRDGQRAEIPFVAEGSWALHEVARAKHAVSDTVQARVLRWTAESRSGALAFSALGRLYVAEPGGEPAAVSAGTGYAPAWSPDGRTLAWTSWVDCPPGAGPEAACGGALHLTSGKRTETLPVRGQLLQPAWSSDGQRLVVLRGVGGGPTVDLGDEPWYEILLVEKAGRSWVSRRVAATSPSGFRAPRLHLHDGRVWWAESRPTAPYMPGEAVLVSVALDGTDKRTHLVVPGAQEIVVSPDFRRVAWKADHQVHVAAFPRARGVTVSADALPRLTLTEVVGDWLHWSPDGRTLGWMVGPTRHTVRLDGLDEKPAADSGAWAQRTLAVAVPRARPTGVLALTNATILTMDGDTVVEKGTVLIDRDRIVAVGPAVAVPPGATVRDLAGKVVIPGLIDVHAHLHYGAGDILPESEWRYRTNLDFGVTTVHDPSASTDLVFTQAERVEAGLMPGPRVFSTGFVLYGAHSPDGAKTPDAAAARRHVERLQAVGATSVKVYQQSRRDQRQWYIEACEALSVRCVAEGGGDLFMNLGMVADGMTAIEHALPVAPLHADVRGFFAASQGVGGAGRGSAYTPTLLVAYGGLTGEHFFFQHENPVNNARLLRNHPKAALDARAWRTKMATQDGDWNHEQVARDAAALAREGVLVTLGAHGQLQGLGVHWELWALAGPGAMSPMEALRAATAGGAAYLGLDGELGTVSVGKLADLVVLDADPRTDIRNTARIAFVVKNGAIWE